MKQKIYVRIKEANGKQCKANINEIMNKNISRYKEQIGYRREKNTKKAVQ